MKQLLAGLKNFFWMPHDEDLGDGMGQSQLTDLLWIKRFKTVAKEHVFWRVPTQADQAAFAGHETLAPFGDFLIAATERGKQSWFVVERIWNGWPDPPKFAFFAMEPERSIWAAADFHRWPKRWTIEEPS